MSSTTRQYPQPRQVLLELAQLQGLLSIDENYNQITFASAEVAEYFCGGWVEEYVFLKFTGTLAPAPSHPGRANPRTA